MEQLENQIIEWLESQGYVKGARVACKERDEVGVLAHPYGIGLDENGRVEYVVFLTVDENEVHVVYNGKLQPIVDDEYMTPEEVFEVFGVKVKLPA